MNSKKKNGQVYTPKCFIPHLLDMCGYYGRGILNKHFIDNSCGDGRILVCAIQRYIAEYKTVNPNTSSEDIRNQIKTYFHGIEYDALSALNAQRTIDARIGYAVGKDIILCADTLSTDLYDGKMDYVIGNPPYIRDVNNVQTTYKEYDFCKDGNTDLYLAFFEKGLKMLKPKTGLLGYLVPEYWRVNGSAKAFRDHIRENDLLGAYYAINGDIPLFPDASVSVCVTVLKPYDYIGNSNMIFVGDFDTVYHMGRSVRSDLGLRHRHSDKVWIDGKLYPFADSDLKDILSSTSHKVKVKYGFCTNNDRFFIQDDIPEKYRLKTIHANTGREEYMFFPYKDGELIQDADDDIVEYCNRHFSDNWSVYGYSYGRSQGIKDVSKNKVAVSYMMPEDGCPIVTDAPAGVGVNAGMYVMGMNVDDVKKHLDTDEFRNYIKSVGSERGSKWYSYTAKDVERFLNWSLEKETINTK